MDTCRIHSQNGTVTAHYHAFESSINDISTRKLWRNKVKVDLASNAITAIKFF